MAWFLWQSILALVLAFLLGLLIGWLLWSRWAGTDNDRGRHARSPADQSELDRLRSELATARTDLDTRSRELAECRDPAGRGPAAPEPVAAEPVAAEPLAAEPAEADPVPERAPSPAPAATVSEPATEPVPVVAATAPEPAAGPVTEPVPVVAAETAPVPVAASDPDDIERIEGIGPKLGAALRRAGYDTFARIAEAGVDDLRGAAAESGITFLPSVTTWSRQARLLADGDDQGHQELTSRLRAGQERA